MSLRKAFLPANGNSNSNSILTMHCLIYNMEFIDSVLWRRVSSDKLGLQTFITTAWFWATLREALSVTLEQPRSIAFHNSTLTALNPSLFRWETWSFIKLIYCGTRSTMFTDFSSSSSDLIKSLTGNARFNSKFPNHVDRLTKTCFHGLNYRPNYCSCP